ncbi:MAG TPA: hypothetical protein VFB46_06605 [Gemmatimonadaceae bacterium]|nr:hypothetical protein [Gemmatimonadaceae bacterium]
MVGAVFHSVGTSQQPPSRDTLAVPQDTAPPAVDTIRTQPDTVVRRDTVQPPLTHAEMPITLDASGRYHWNREELFAGGGLTLLELLERIPGVTGFRSGWVASPAHTTWLGGGGRVRVFYDGIELEPFDVRSGGLLDLSEIQLWTLEEVLVERGGDELRVYLRSWRVERTTTASRTDVFTGDEDTNYYRGYIGRRFSHGEAAQVGFQQYGTSGPSSGGGDELALIARLGWAGRVASIDAFGIRGRRQRNTQTSDDGYTIPRVNSIRRDTYVRVGLGDADRGAWAQVVLGGQSFTRERIDPAESSGDTNDIDTIEEKRSRNQLVGAVGWSGDLLRASITSRSYARADGFQSLTGRLSLAHRFAGVSALGEWRGDDSSSLGEVSVRLSPFSFLSFSGVASLRRHPADLQANDLVTARGEVALRIRSLWFSGGVVRLDSIHVTPLVVFDSSYVPHDEGPTMALYGGVRGRVWRAIHADVFAFRWERQGFYRPQLQLRSEIYVRTRWLKKFPSGQFGALISVRHDYRDGIAFPTDEGPEVARSAHELSSLFEIRLVDAVLFWRQQYTLGQLPNEFIPGFAVPRQLTLYGVRWDFWN